MKVAFLFASLVLVPSMAHAQEWQYTNPTTNIFEEQKPKRKVRRYDTEGYQTSQIVGGRPSGCPHKFCGCAMSIRRFGRIVTTPNLNQAATWMRFPRTAPAPGMVAARGHHVFELMAHISGLDWLVWDPNSGGQRIRIHRRSIAGHVIVNPDATNLASL